MVGLESVCAARVQMGLYVLNLKRHLPKDCDSSKSDRLHLRHVLAAHYAMDAC